MLRGELEILQNRRKCKGEVREIEELVMVVMVVVGEKNVIAAERLRTKRERNLYEAET